MKFSKVRKLIYLSTLSGEIVQLAVDTTTPEDDGEIGVATLTGLQLSVSPKGDVYHSTFNGNGDIQMNRHVGRKARFA